jgi:hypothetical protein
MKPPGRRFGPVRPAGVVHEGGRTGFDLCTNTNEWILRVSGTATSWGGTKEEQRASGVFNNKRLVNLAGIGIHDFRHECAGSDFASRNFAQKSINSYHLQSDVLQLLSIDPFLDGTLAIATRPHGTTHGWGPCARIIASGLRQVGRGPNW